MRIIATILAAILPVACAFASAETGSGQSAGKAAFVRHLDAGEKQTVVMIGTSLTEGVPPGTLNWVGELKETLDKKYPGKATVINLGRGASATAAPTGPRCGLEMVKQAVAAKPDAVFIEYGMNDSYLPYHITVEQSRKNLNTIIDRILAANPKTEVILQTMNCCKDYTAKNPGWKHATERPGLPRYYQVVRDVAKRRGLLLVDHYPNWLAVMRDDPALFDRYVPDRIHPCAEGCRAVIMPTLLKAVGLEKN